MFNVLDVFCVDCVLLYSEGFVVFEAGVVDEDLGQNGGMYCKVRIFCFASD